MAVAGGTHAGESNEGGVEMAYAFETDREGRLGDGDGQVA
jgi:hypothetical protein